MKLADEISRAELNSLIESSSVLPELANADGWERQGNVLYHRGAGVVVETHDQSEPCAYSDMDDVGVAILREAGCVE